MIIAKSKGSVKDGANVGRKIKSVVDNPVSPDLALGYTL